MGGGGGGLAAIFGGGRPPGPMRLPSSLSRVHTCRNFWSGCCRLTSCPVVRKEATAAEPVPRASANL